MSKRTIEEIPESSAFGQAKVIGSEWLSGKRSGLYMLSCGAWEHWTIDDIDSMISDLENIEDIDARDEASEAIAILTELKEAFVDADATRDEGQS